MLIGDLVTSKEEGDLLEVDSGAEDDVEEDLAAGEEEKKESESKEKEADPEEIKKANNGNPLSSR